MSYNATAATILEQVFLKAISNGWQSPYAVIFKEFPKIAESFITNDEHLKIVYNHDFAECFWGIEPELISGINRGDYVNEWVKNHKHYSKLDATNIANRDWEYWVKTGDVLPAYQWRLKEMVTHFDAIDYLSIFT